MVTAFDAAKYERLMNGLEAVEMKLSEVEDNIDFRADSEFYKKPPIINNNLDWVKVSDILSYVQYGLSIDMNEERNGYLIYRMNEIHDMLCDITVLKYAAISKADKEVFKLKDRDVLFNRTNSQVFVGRTGLFKKFDNNDYVFASYLIRLRTNEEKILPEYLTTFFDSTVGKWDLKRRARISINQSNINAEEVKAVRIPLLSISFQNKIKEAFDKAHNYRYVAQKIYEDAETLLLEELGLHKWQPTQSNTVIKTFNNSFFHSGRLDAEYYQPKYEELTAKIKTVEYDSLQNLVIIKKSIEPGSDAYMEEGVPFIRVSNLSKYGLTAPDIFLYKQQFDNLEKLYLKKDTVLLTKDGSVGIAYKVDEDMDAVTSGAILHLTINNKKIIPDYLALVLNSVLVQMQAERDAGGSIIQHWRSNEVEQVLIPVIDMNKQLEIAALVQQSFALKKQSAHLLNTAKRAVEMAIEESEEAAMAFIKERVSSEA